MKGALLKIALLFISFYLTAQENITPPIITFFIRPDTHLKKTLEPQTLIHKTEKLGALERAILKAKLAPAITQGIYALYAGMVAYSDSNGQVIFPRKHTKDNVTLVIAPRIQPVFLIGNVIHHFIVPDKVSAEQYLLTRKGETPPYWHIEKQSLPPAGRILNTALIVFAKVDDMVIPDVDIVTTSGSNLVLPTLYVKPTMNPSSNALHFLKINRYFSPAKRFYRFTNDRYGIIMNP